MLRYAVDMPDRILVVEDDEALRKQVARTLGQAGFEVESWGEGRRVDADNLPDVQLVVLDLMLPGVAGLDLLRELRSHSEVPVLVLSARIDTHDKVRALQLGADDYMTKPFWPAELVERVKARLRRPVLQRDDSIRHGDLVVSTRARTAHRGERSLGLSPAEFDMLLALLERRGQAVTRSWLGTRVLGEDDPTARALDVHMSRLRKKLGRPSVIETVWGIGYRIPEDAG